MDTNHPRCSEALALSERLRAARADHRRAERTLALLLVEMVDRRLHAALGYTSLAAYAAAVLDLPARTTRDLVRVGRALPDLPKLDAALAAGELDWTKARELVRVVTDETEEAWIARAKTVNSRVLEQEVSASCAGEMPPTGAPEDRPDPSRVRMSFTMEAQDRQVIRDGLAILRARSDLDGEEIEDGELLAAVMRRVIAEVEPEHGPTGERYRVVLEHCPDCKRTRSPGAEVSDTVSGEAACDAEFVEMRPGPTQGHATRAIPPALRRAVICRARGSCEAPGCDNRLWLDVHHVAEWSKGRRHREHELVVLCSSHHRAIHAGGLALEIVDARVVVTHADGRRLVGPPRAHVGRAAWRPEGVAPS